ncbi:MAG: helix-turn-helix transcriptional regulator [Solobacterium sp.]|nr:helix-turn-helix transcriptional regulator [Solobacterium sp.]
MNQEKFARFITQRRKQLNLTQKDIAEKLHVSISAVSKYERGLSYPDITLLEPLSQILEVTIVDLLKGEISHNDLSSLEASDLFLELISKQRLKEYRRKILLSDILYIILLFITAVTIILLFVNGIIPLSKLFEVITAAALIFLGILMFKNYRHSIYGARFKDHFKD